VLAKVLPDTPVSLSSEVLPELMEYERTITTARNILLELRGLFC
jgi:N-methylhydantoinase A/oxoprolinase/acetone carboxylase beta subunit